MPFLTLSEPKLSFDTNIDEECYLVDLASSHMLALKIKPYISMN